MKESVLARIRRLGPGKSFMAKDFLDIATRGSVDMVLSSLLREGAIRRIRRGLYDVPRQSEALGRAVSPNTRHLTILMALEISTSGDRL